MSQRPTASASLAITFLYYRDLAGAIRFYEEVMGFALAIDQGWSKIYRIAGGAHIGLVDEAHGMHKWAETRPVQIAVRVSNVDEWYAWIESQGCSNLSDMFDSEHLGIRAFVFDDPEGYQIEIQTATRPGA